MKTAHTIAVVTGAGHGIGRAIAWRLAEGGAEVVVADKDEQAAQAVATEVAAAQLSAVAVSMDITDEESVLDGARRIRETAGAPAILVDNAGIAHGGRFDDQSIESHLEVVRVNLEGSMRVTAAFLPDLLGQPEARIVMMSSAGGQVGMAYAAGYAASKWGLIGLAESLRREMIVTGNQHVGVTVVLPGYVDTRLALGTRLPRLTRMLKPDEVARRAVEAIEQDVDTVRLPWLSAVTPAIRGLLPAAAQAQLYRLLRVDEGMRSWRPASGQVKGPRPDAARR